MTRLSELHYIELSLGEGANEIRPAVLSCVHKFNARNSNALGVDFFGKQARVFGSKASLESFISQDSIRRLAMLSETPVGLTPVPSSQEGVRLMRSRQASRQQPARLRRFERRNPGVIRQDAGTKPIQPALALAVHSTSTKQDFLLKLDRRVAQPSSVLEFTSYGLCREGTVLPRF